MKVDAFLNLMNHITELRKLLTDPQFPHATYISEVALQQLLSKRAVSAEVLWQILYAHQEILNGDL